MEKSLFTFTVALLVLTGCNQEKMPEPNAATCAPLAFQAALNEMRSESNRVVFTEECKAVQKAKQMRRWEFNPSAKDDY